jgi:hypothetical protein
MVEKPYGTATEILSGLKREIEMVKIRKEMPMDFSVSEIFRNGIVV